MLRRSGVRRIAEREKTRPNYQISEEAVIRLAGLGEEFLAAISRECWRVLAQTNSPLQNNGVRVRLQTRDVREAVHRLLNEPGAMERLVVELAASEPKSAEGSGAS